MFYLYGNYCFYVFYMCLNINFMFHTQNIKDSILN
uniref:Uncharacterized protein n=1 Tax=Platysiphonia delicata TaxID=2006979 RepID=A0A1Z1M0M9_9FLOR|nr:hypothetical protein [Platysiphonia delicata]ARW59626.1 hypothetical protein [Platysiphonia delicata]